MPNKYDKWLSEIIDGSDKPSNDGAGFDVEIEKGEIPERELTAAGIESNEAVDEKPEYIELVEGLLHRLSRDDNPVGDITMLKEFENSSSRSQNNYHPGLFENIPLEEVQSTVATIDTDDVNRILRKTDRATGVKNNKSCSEYLRMIQDDAVAKKENIAKVDKIIDSFENNIIPWQESKGKDLDKDFRALAADRELGGDKLHVHIQDVTKKLELLKKFLESNIICGQELTPKIPNFDRLQNKYDLTFEEEGADHAAFEFISDLDFSVGNFHEYILKSTSQGKISTNDLHSSLSGILKGGDQFFRLTVPRILDEHLSSLISNIDTIASNVTPPSDKEINSLKTSNQHLMDLANDNRPLILQNRQISQNLTVPSEILSLVASINSRKNMLNRYATNSEEIMVKLEVLENSKEKNFLGKIKDNDGNKSIKQRINDLEDTMPDGRKYDALENEIDEMKIKLEVAESALNDFIADPKFYLDRRAETKKSMSISTMYNNIISHLEGLENVYTDPEGKEKIKELIIKGNKHLLDLKSVSQIEDNKLAIQAIKKHLENTDDRIREAGNFSRTDGEQLFNHEILKSYIDTRETEIGKIEEATGDLYTYLVSVFDKKKS